MNVLRTKTILVILIIPLLGNSDACLTRCMGVGNGISSLIDRSCIFSYFLFLNCIDDFFTILEFWKTCKVLFPICRIREFFLSNFFTIGKKIHNDTCWTKTILIVLVIPNLGHWNIDHRWRMRIGQDRMSSVRGIGSDLVAFRNRDFFHTVADSLTSFLFS